MAGFKRVVPMFAAITLALLKDHLDVCASPKALEIALRTQAHSIQVKQLQDAAEMFFMPQIRHDLVHWLWCLVFGVWCLLVGGWWWWT